MIIHRLWKNAGRNLGKNFILCTAGVALDWLFGDPRILYHPVRMMGKLISWLEKPLRRWAGEDSKKQERAGGILWALTAGISSGMPFMILKAVRKKCGAAALALETFWCFQLLAARSLQSESMKVYEHLEADDLPGARKAVSMIVGRDTENLTEKGVTKAAVETVAENTSDGVTAPLLYMLAGGPVLGFFYKAINTMDSMLGYKNEKNLHFGRMAAKMDDLANYIPSRISALLMILSSAMLGMDGAGALKIWRRDRRKHASPNAAQTESVCAGALGVELAGDAYYFGKLYEKDTIGDPVRPIETEDIKKANWLMASTELVTLLIFGGVGAILWLISTAGISIQVYIRWIFRRISTLSACLKRSASR